MDPTVRPHVLLVDPDADTRAVLRALLWHDGYYPLGVDEGEGALAVAREAGAALVIATLYVPTAREPCIVRALKRDPALRAVPVLVYTAFARAADEAWALDAGCDGFLTKPTELPVLLREVRRLAGAPAGDANAALSGSA